MWEKGSRGRKRGGGRDVGEGEEGEREGEKEGRGVHREYDQESLRIRQVKPVSEDVWPVQQPPGTWQSSVQRMQPTGPLLRGPSQRMPHPHVPPILRTCQQ